MDADKIIGTTVVAAGGEELGKVADLFIDPRASRLAALRVNGKSGTFLVAEDQVAAIEPESVRVTLSQPPDLPPEGVLDGAFILDAVRRMPVVLEHDDDAAPGTVKAIILDPATRQITRLTVQRGGLLGFGGETLDIEAADIREIGRETITVAR